ncbi:hypothetical protein DEA98_14320 [Brucella pseudogrignonensis]|uniref:Uncharacterized protein n=1 Tax=Brucella pseudogrignonensis TaxID=419475 RepID=A0A7Y3WWV4_9HYPH|nr:hypothetical protein [Brucella pseudogrignonensis]MCM0752038.1 hypothetical protein [Brucella pseudogrignonensis]NNV20531.1 hypothetical protein [Brucella pseudogrignonensis]
MALFAVADSKIFIGPQKDDQATDFVAADFASIDPEDWVEIDGWETCGQIGDNAAVITTALINRGRDVKQKGTKNAGSMQNNFAVIPGDAGQTAFIAAAATNQNYAFKIEWSSGVKNAFVGLAMTNQRQGGQANTVDLSQMTIEVNSNVVTLP